MRKLLAFTFLGASLAASIAACVDDYKSDSTAAKQGEQGGPCFPNSACNAGLVCGVVGGNAQCLTADGGTGVTSSSSSSGSSSSSSSGSHPEQDAATNDSGTSGDSGPTACKFATPQFPCGGDQPPAACLGATQSCTLTGCGGASDVRWSCFSVKECMGSGACCVAKANATLTAGVDCDPGTLAITINTATGADCAATKCEDNDTQLCRASSDCPTGKRCTPVKVTNAGASFNNQTLGVCTP